SGTLSNGIVILETESGTGLELDGPEGSAATEAGFTMEHITLIGNGSSSLIADLRDGLIAKLDNVLVHGFAATSSVKIAGADSANELANDRIVFSQWEIILAAGAVAEDTFTGDFLAGDEV